MRLLERSGIIPAERFSSLAREFEEPQGDSPNAEQIANALVERSVLTRWQADQLLDGKYKGFILGPYRILRPLGQGGMGTVFLAEHQMMRRRCAVKVLPAKRVQTQPALLEWFYREAQAVAALDHPNIVRAYDVNMAVQDGREIHYLVMEYIDGQDLQHRVLQQGLPGYGEAADWIRQAAEGLAHAHEAGFVHRDIKPANLLVDSRGLVKILDLGLARFFNEADDSASVEQGGMVVGTADYVAPEQVVDSQNVDARADIYSLGHTFYFLLTGHPPFPDGSVPQRLLAHQTKFPEPVQRERPDVSPELVAIINRMTAKKPKDRQQTAREVADVLKKWLQGSPEHSGFLRRFLRTPQTAATSSAPVHETHENGSTATDEADLELAPIEEDKPPTSSGAFRTTHLPSPTPPAGDNSPRETTDNLSASIENQTLTELPVEKPQSAGSGLSELSPPADPLAALLDAENFPPAVQQPAEGPSAGTATAKRPTKKKGSSEALLHMPVFWVGVGGMVFVIAIVWFVASQMSSSEISTAPVRPVPSVQPSVAPEPSQSSEPEETPEIEATSDSQRTIDTSGDDGTASQPEPATAPSTPSASEKTEKPDDTPAAKAPREDSASPTPPKAPADRPAKPPKEKTPAKAPGKAPASQQAKPPEKEPPKAEPPKVDSKALLGGMQSLRFQFSKSLPNQAFNAMVVQSAFLASQRADLVVAENAEAVMDVSIQAQKPAQPGQLAPIVMKAELKCKAPHDEKEIVKVWEHQAQIGEVSPPMLRQRQLQLLLRSDVKKFFDKFVDDYREASN